MNKKPITHLVIDTSSTDENYNGDCDYALVPMTPDYVEDLLWYMGEVARMRRADECLYSIELWDATPAAPVAAILPAKVQGRPLIQRGARGKASARFQGPRTFPERGALR
jgi:hypothetical protein